MSSSSAAILEGTALRAHFAHLRDAGLKRLYETWKLRDDLTELDMDGNDLTADAADVIAALIRNNKQLTKVSLQWNQLGDPACLQTICRAVEEHASLERLALQHNDIGQAAAPLLRSLLIRNRTLVYVDLSWNCLGSAGVNIIAEAFQKNFKLLSCCLTGNSVSSDVLALIEERLRRNMKMTTEIATRDGISSNQYNATTVAAVTRTVSGETESQVFKAQHRLYVVQTEQTMLELKQKIDSLNEKLEGEAQRNKSCTLTIQALEGRVQEVITARRQDQDEASRQIRDLTVANELLARERDQLAASIVQSTDEAKRRMDSHTEKLQYVEGLLSHEKELRIAEKTSSFATTQEIQRQHLENLKSMRLEYEQKISQAEQTRLQALQERKTMEDVVASYKEQLLAQRVEHEEACTKLQKALQETTAKLEGTRLTVLQQQIENLKQERESLSAQLKNTADRSQEAAETASKELAMVRARLSEELAARLHSDRESAEHKHLSARLQCEVQQLQQTVEQQEKVAHTLSEKFAAVQEQHSAEQSKLLNANAETCNQLREELRGKDESITKLSLVQHQLQLQLKAAMAAQHQQQLLVLNTITALQANVSKGGELSTVETA